MARWLFIGLLSLLVLLLGPIAIELIRQDSGYILISIGDTTIETSFWLVALPLSIWLIFVAIRLIIKTLRYFGVGLKFFSNQRSRQSVRRTQRGLLHYIEGNWRAAKKDLLSVARQADQPVINYLAAAHSAHHLGDSDETQRLLALAESVAPEKNTLAVYLSQARIHLSEKKYEQCLAVLQQAQSLAPSHPVVLDLLRQVYAQVNDWSAVIALLPMLKSRKLYSDAEFRALEEQAYCANLVEESKLGDADSRLQRVTKVWQKIPRALRRSPTLIGRYCGILREAGQDDKAEILLRQTLSKAWDSELITLYGQLNVSQPNEQLLVAEQWLREHPGDSQLLFSLARICMRVELWGKARNYFESSLQLREQPEAYAELAALLAHLGDHQKSTALYQKGLLSSTSQLDLKK